MAESRWLRAALRRMADLAVVDPEVRARRVTAADVAAVRDGKQFAIELVAAVCERYASRAAFARCGSVITYGELWQRARAVASGLVRVAGVRCGDRVLVCGEADIDWVVADVACLYAGAVSVPVPSTASAEELAQISAQTEPRCALGTSGGLELARLEAEGSMQLLAPADPEPDAVFSIVFTSGSTGALKGVVIPERRWMETLRDALKTIPMPTITLGYLPPSHMAGRIALYHTLMAGGVTHFVSSGDLSTLFDDLRAVRPTSLTLIPRVSGLLYQHYQLELARRDDTHGAAIMAQMREQLLGGRLCFATTGAAPTPPEVIAFIERCFEIYVVDTYGSTELGRVTVDGRVQPGIEYKLVDLPELGYTRADTPYPRGELAVKTERGAPGYYNDPEATAQLRDDEGYMLSGDIVEERAPGHLVWIDRKHAVVRLANGESVNLSRLEDGFAANSRYIAQIFLDTSPMREYLVAVVVVHGDASDAIVQRELDRVAAANGLRAHENPRAHLVEREPFSAANGLLTETGKPRRARLRAAYRERLDALCARIEARQVAALAQTATTAERVRDAIALVVGRERADVADDSTFVQLGGDSFSALRLVGLLADHAGTRLPVSVLLDPAATVATLIQRCAASEPAGEHAGEWVRANQLRVADLVPKAVVDAERLPATDAPKVVLLTGATGFLGRQLMRELLSRVDEVVCLVRARDDDEARARLVATLGELPSRLTVYQGDLARSELGLSNNRYRELAHRVDAIVHAGALVNHALGFEHLYEPNVLGSAEMCRLALTARVKPIHFVSTTGIAGGVRRRVLESEHAQTLWSRRARNAVGYAAGYVTSKWAAEIVLCDLHDQCGVPITITRCGMLLPHRELPIFNARDGFSRLVYGIARTGLAPESFYTGERRRYDGLPVDCVAAFVAGIAARQASGLAIYHACDPSGELSLDAIAPAMIGAGHPVEQLPYAQWFARFREALAALPDEARRRSPAPIIERWEHPTTDRDVIDLDATHFAAAHRELTGQPLPRLDGAFVAHCIRSICGGAQ